MSCMKRKDRINLRRRTNPKVYDFSYVYCKHHLQTLKHFASLTDGFGSVPIILDVGCGAKPLKGFFPGARYLGIDVDPESEADFVLDCNRDTLPLPDDSVDAIVLSNSLEHIYNIKHLLGEIQRVLKASGLVYFSVPMTYPVHAHPEDYHRFTPYYFKEAFFNWNIIQLSGTNSVFSTPLLLIAQLLETIFPNWITFLPIVTLNAAALFVDYSTKCIVRLSRTRGLTKLWADCPLEKVWSSLPIEINGILQMKRKGEGAF
jgi:SAM-dependent methyltransferase